MASHLITGNEFYCTQCGNKGLPVVRKKGAEREAGHLKKLFCLHCQKEVNFCEIQPFAQRYTYQDFLLEFEQGNFNKEGNRVMPFGKFKDKMVKEGKYEQYQRDI